MKQPMAAASTATAGRFSTAGGSAEWSGEFSMSSRLQVANATLVAENASLSASQRRLTHDLAEARVEQQKLRAKSAEMRAELMLQRRAAAQERRASHTQLELALDSLQHERHAHSSLESDREQQLALHRHAVARSHALVEENSRLRHQVSATEAAMLSLEREKAAVHSELKAAAAREAVYRRRCEAQQEKIEKLRLELQAQSSLVHKLQSQLKEGRADSLGQHASGRNHAEEAATARPTKLVSHSISSHNGDISTHITEVSPRWLQPTKSWTRKQEKPVEKPLSLRAYSPTQQDKIHTVDIS